MIRIIRTSRLHELLDAEAAGDNNLAEAGKWFQQAEASKRDAESARTIADDLQAELDRVRAELDKMREEAEAARAQVLLDAEDRVALRALLRSARKQAARADRVFALFSFGRLHSLHATAEAAEEAAEAEGAPRSGWTDSKPGAVMPPAAEVPWRIQPLSLGG